MFKNLRIGARLGLGFGVVLILLVALIWLGMSRMSGLNDQLHQVTDVDNKKLALAVEMRGAVRNVAVAARNVVLLSDDAEIQKETQRIADEHAKYAAAAEKLAQMVTSVRGKELLAKIADTRAAAVPLVDKAIKLGLAHDSKNATAALINPK